MRSDQNIKFALFFSLLKIWYEILNMRWDMKNIIFSLIFSFSFKNQSPGIISTHLGMSLILLLLLVRMKWKWEKWEMIERMRNRNSWFEKLWNQNMMIFDFCFWLRFWFDFIDWYISFHWFWYFNQYLILSDFDSFWLISSHWFDFISFQALLSLVLVPC